MIPECPWRFGERYLATDFVQVNNVAVIETANSLDTGNFISDVARWVRDEFYYPLDNSGNPSAQGQLLRHQKSLFSGYHAKKCVYYAWSLPNEILDFAKCGICIDTANLATSILRVKGIDAWVTLGDVRDIKSDTLLGRHAWVTLPYEEENYVLETTIHEAGMKNMAKTSDVYDKNSDWAKRGGVYFVYQGKYNEKEFKGEGPLGSEIVELLGLPAHRVLLFGKQKTATTKTGQLKKEWESEEKMITNLLREAYGGL